jgi:CIC family chloride channel protein
MTAVLIIFELTGDYKIILPLMLAVVVATALSGRLSPGSIYTLKLKRRGIDLDLGHARRPVETIPVPDAPAVAEAPEGAAR